MNFDRELLRLLKEELELLQQSQTVLEFVWENCRDYEIDANLSESQKSSIDALSVRFVRSYEVFSKQVIRTVLALLGEEKSTFIDTMNKAEQLNMISSVQTFYQLRKLRNQMVHAYIPSKWIAIYRSLFWAVPQLLSEFERCRAITVDRFSLR